LSHDLNKTESIGLRKAFASAILQIRL